MNHQTRSIKYQKFNCSFLSLKQKLLYVLLTAKPLQDNLHNNVLCYHNHSNGLMHSLTSLRTICMVDYLIKKQEQSSTQNSSLLLSKTSVTKRPKSRVEISLPNQSTKQLVHLHSPILPTNPLNIGPAISLCPSKNTDIFTLKSSSMQLLQFYVKNKKIQKFILAEPLLVTPYNINQVYDAFVDLKLFFSYNKKRNLFNFSVNKTPNFLQIEDVRKNQRKRESYHLEMSDIYCTARKKMKLNPHIKITVPRQLLEDWHKYLFSHFFSLNFELRPSNTLKFLNRKKSGGNNASDEKSKVKIVEQLHIQKPYSHLSNSSDPLTPTCVASKYSNEYGNFEVSEQSFIKNLQRRQKYPPYSITSGPPSHEEIKLYTNWLHVNIVRCPSPIVNEIEMMQKQHKSVNILIDEELPKGNIVNESVPQQKNSNLSHKTAVRKRRNVHKSKSVDTIKKQFGHSSKKDITTVNNSTSITNTNNNIEKVLKKKLVRSRPILPRLLKGSKKCCKYC